MKLQDQNENESNNNNLLQASLTIILSLFALIIAMAQLLQVPCIQGLTYTDSCATIGNSKFFFAIDTSSIEIVQFLLKHWLSLIMGMPIAIVILVTFLSWWRIKRWVNNNIGHGVLGGQIRVILAFAVSERYGRLLTYLWILMLIALFSILLIASTGYWRFNAG